MAGNEAAWALVLNGVTLTGGASPTGIGTLTNPPDGTGLPELRTEDVTYPQRDGVQHFDDWYLPRFITAEDVYVCNDGCPGCPTARQKVRTITDAWRRSCDDEELVVFTDCPPGETAEERQYTGPFGVIGRPRVAQVRWERSNIGCASLLLRFDAVDQRLYILDADGAPGSGEVCVTLTADAITMCRVYPRCYPMCYDTMSSPAVTGGGPEDLTVVGNVCAQPTITLTGPLTSPTIENESTGLSITYGSTIALGDPDVIIDTSTGTATQDGQSRTNFLSGTVKFFLGIGVNTLRLRSFGASDTGAALVCWRNSVDSM